MTLREPQGGSDPETPVPVEPQPGIERYRAAARRAPKVGVFLVLGGLLGAIVAAILTAVHGAGTTQSSDGSGAVSDNGLWIFVVFFFSIGIGVAVGGIVALILDRASRRRIAIVTVERGVVEATNADAAEAEDVTVSEAAADGSDAPAAEAAPGSEVAENSSPDAGGRA